MSIFKKTVSNTGRHRFYLNPPDTILRYALRNEI